MSPLDIRDRESLDAREIIALNFIRSPGVYVFRKHHFRGMRSHIFQVLDPRDVKTETAGIVVDGVTRYPRAKPLRMLRLFRTKFRGIGEALAEINTVRIIERYLAPLHLARSNEFLVDYATGHRTEPMLCGLQEYIDGERLDLWNPINIPYLLTLPDQLKTGTKPAPEDMKRRFVAAVQKSTAEFVNKTKEMIAKAHCVPDLAGTGNLIITASGNIKLVDINNVSRVRFRHGIDRDDKGYPACDMSIVALSLLETKLLNRAVDSREAIYRIYLDPLRRKAVQSILQEFHAQNMSSVDIPVS